MPSVDLDNEFLELLYSLTNSNVPSNINIIELKRQLTSIADIVRNNPPRRVISGKSFDNDSEEDAKGPAILVVDDLGVITYQLKVLLSKFEYDIECSQEIYDAVNKFKKRKHCYVVMDLFIPTEREGFILLTELRKLANAYGTRTVIGVITASPRKEIEQQCKMRGADFFLEKSNDWQTALTNVMDEYISADKGEQEDF